MAEQPETLNRGTMASELWRSPSARVDIIIESILLTVVFISLGLRLWSRSLQRVQLQLNDYLIIVATVLMAARYSLMMVIDIKCGVGIHIEEVIYIAGPDVITLFAQCLYVIDLLWVTLVSLIKLSILHFYLMVFRQKAFRIAVYITMGICSAFWAGAFFAGAFFCNPPQKQWYPDTPGHCGDRQKFTSIPSSTDLGLEVIVILLPMPVLWGLQLPVAKKIALTGVFSLGALIIGITAYRVKPMLALDTADLTYSAGSIAVLASTVPLLGIINANLPLTPPAFKKMFKKFPIGSTQQKSTGYGYGGTSDSDRRRQFSKLQEPEVPLVHVRGQAPSSYSVQSEDPGQIKVTTDWEVQSWQGSKEAPTGPNRV